MGNVAKQNINHLLFPLCSFLHLQDQEESHPPPTSAPASSTAGKATNAMPDIFSKMLKDTTAEHRAHLFDLNCKICTGKDYMKEYHGEKNQVFSLAK